MQLKKKRSRTCFVSKFCNVLLHKGDCFEQHHTIKKYYLKKIIIWVMEYYININLKMILVDRINIKVYVQPLLVGKMLCAVYA